MQDTILLNPVEQRLCRYVARCRHENNRKSGIVNARIGWQSDEETDLEGIAAEVAFCRLQNVYPDLSIDVRSSGKGQDHKFDCVLHTGETVDVKATVYATGHLLAAPWKGTGSPPDLYALMVGKFPSYTFKGFMPGVELLSQKRLGNMGHGPTYIAKQSELFVRASRTQAA